MMYICICMYLCMYRYFRICISHVSPPKRNTIAPTVPILAGNWSFCRRFSLDPRSSTIGTCSYPSWHQGTRGNEGISGRNEEWSTPDLHGHGDGWRWIGEKDPFQLQWSWSFLSVWGVGWVFFFDDYTPRKLTWQWKLIIFDWRYIFKMVGFSMVMLVWSLDVGVVKVL